MVGYAASGVPCALVALVALAGTALEARQQSPAATSPDGESLTIVACVVREDDLSPRVSPGAEGTTQILLTDVRSGRPTHALTGTREAEFAPHVGRRVRVTGTVEQPRFAAAAADLPGDPNPGATVAGEPPPPGDPHEPPTSVLGVDRVGDDRPRRAAVDDPAYIAAILPRVNATSFAPVDGACAAPPARAAAGAAPSDGEQPAPARVAVVPPPPVAPLTAIGCLARQTSDGPALSAQDEVSRDEFVLTGASLSRPSPPPVTVAVPGSIPSGDGSGTVPARPAPRTPGVDEVTLAFALLVDREDVAALTQHIGRRVEVVGSVEEPEPQITRDPREDPRQAGTTGRVEIPPAPAHPAAPVRRLSVASVRVLGGACR